MRPRVDTAPHAEVAVGAAGMASAGDVLPAGQAGFKKLTENQCDSASHSQNSVAWAPPEYTLPPPYGVLRYMTHVVIINT